MAYASEVFLLKAKNILKIIKIFYFKFEKNEIDFIFETRTKEQTITELILDKNCLSKERLSEMLIRFKILKDCKDFR